MQSQWQLSRALVHGGLHLSTSFAPTIPPLHSCSTTLTLVYALFLPHTLFSKNSCSAYRVLLATA